MVLPFRRSFSGWCSLYCYSCGVRAGPPPSHNLCGNQHMRDFCGCLWAPVAWCSLLPEVGFVSDLALWLLWAGMSLRLALLRHKTLWGLVGAVVARWISFITELLSSDSKWASIIMIQRENTQWSVTHVTPSSIYVVQQRIGSVLSSSMKYLCVLGFPSTLCWGIFRACFPFGRERCCRAPSMHREGWEWPLLEPSGGSRPRKDDPSLLAFTVFW